LAFEKLARATAPASAVSGEVIHVEFSAHPAA
jgi:hypothetical protein